MNSITRTLVYNAHPASLILGCGSVMSGLTASVIRGGVDLIPALTTLVFAMLLQVSANLYHGYLDLNYGAGENIGGSGDRDSRSHKSTRVKLMKVVADAFGITAITCGTALFGYVEWVGVCYLAVLMLILYFYFAGPSPLVRTQWSIIVTFFLFGPFGVSGTALVQNLHNPNWLPIVTYSLINGLMAANAHIAIQLMRYKEDIVNDKMTLVICRGLNFTRWVYLVNVLVVCAILIIRPCVIEFVSPWVGISISVALILSSLVVFFKMKGDPYHVSRLVRSITMKQYILIIVVMLVIVLYSVEDFHISLFREF